jgi:ribosomal-protein-alanine N-acetyltransferase
VNTALDGPVVRRARVLDAPILAALERACFALPWSETQLAAELRGPGAHCLIAAGPTDERREDLDGHAIGYALFRQVAGEAELLRLAVLPAVRRRGLAQRLLRAGLRELHVAGCTAAFLEVSERNEPAVRLYEREGWRRDGRRPGYYPDGSAALLYRCEP